MITIPVRVCGDHWLNPDEVRNWLVVSDLTQPITLDVGAEGPSLQALGVFDLVDEINQDNGRSPETVCIDNWLNPVEESPYKRTVNPRASHFFWRSDAYNQTPIAAATHEYQFAMFIGRRTIPRAVMLWHMYRDHGNCTLFSLMNSPYADPWNAAPHGRDLENWDAWLSTDDQRDFREWWREQQLGSLDGHGINDQYDHEQNTNRDLLAHYHKFDIEIVSETYTRGDTFFPTEKTVRALAAGKPMLVYGPRNFLKRLRDMGFQTWHTVWNESYDTTEGPERWELMRGMIKKLSQQRVADHCREICRHNQLHLQEIISKYRPT